MFPDNYPIAEYLKTVALSIIQVKLDGMPFSCSYGMFHRHPWGPIKDPIEPHKMPSPPMGSHEIQRDPIGSP